MSKRSLSRGQTVAGINTTGKVCSRAEVPTKEQESFLQGAPPNLLGDRPELLEFLAGVLVVP